ncbi:hypothetical protein K474DRAFT_1658920 [Panus rudis PR-1116 ss-1]|nr:hypothetical protein K474DRAFT_1658920 [Panus rudis PR-1116 ss-1]
MVSVANWYNANLAPAHPATCTLCSSYDPAYNYNTETRETVEPRYEQDRAYSRPPDSRASSSSVETNASAVSVFSAKDSGGQHGARYHRTWEEAAELLSDPPQSWKDIVLHGEREGQVPVYDDCSTIRRKIRALRKHPDFHLTRWLNDIGGISTSSYYYFMRCHGAVGGAGSAIYYAAYVYFEKRRIFEGKRKSERRLRVEREHPNGLPLDELHKHRARSFL